MFLCCFCFTTFYGAKKENNQVPVRDPAGKSMFKLINKNIRLMH